MTEQFDNPNELEDSIEVSVIIRNKNIRKKRKHAAIIRNTAITLVCVVLGIIISIQYKSLSAAENITSSDSDKIASLQAQQLKLIQENEGLLTAKEELEQKVALLESATNEEQIQKLEEELNKIKMFCGTTKVTGDGIYISIVLQEEMYPSTLQRHLLTIINELKASTAQAISINGERITAMTEIRVVGNYVVINGRQTEAQKFEIYAIGQPQALLSGVLLSGNGPLANLKNENTCEVTYTTLSDIVIDACKPQDIVTGLLQNAE